MKPDNINLDSLRAKKARLGHAIGKSSAAFLIGSSLIIGAGAIAALMLTGQAYFYFILSLSLFLFIFASWVKGDLLVLEPLTDNINDRLSIDILSLLKKDDNTALAAYKRLSKHWQAYFITNHLLIAQSSIEILLSDTPEQNLQAALDQAAAYADKLGSKQIELAFLYAALLATSPAFKEYLIQSKMEQTDIDEIVSWLWRLIESSKRKKQNFGGIGRDWAFGFTNFLNRFALNISQSIMNHGSNFGWLTSSNDVVAIENALTNNAGAVVLVGPTGIGKTSRVYALAQRMIEGKSSKKLEYHQILQLDAASIISSANKPGALEFIFTQIVHEAANAGHVILFLDDAELFFSEGTGSINAAAILQPYLQNRTAQFIMTLTPEDYQRLRATNASLANLLTPVMLSELPQKDIMNILEDTAGGMEFRYKCVIAYEAIKSAYRLSGRYNSDEAYPGKAIKLLEQAVSHATNNVVSIESVEAAVEQTHGVKVSLAKPAEADALLHLENKIHERMINQNEAVKAVSAALRRARAGVSNPNRPIGSFLFLGPTGVGKTELAKAIAATYFGSENSIIRLDMSEYQQDSDVSRLLNPGTDNSISFLMSIRQQPFSVVLLDEVEKANPSILNLLLQLLDEGHLTDESGRSASFKDAVIIATSNAGANDIRQQIAAGGSLADFKDSLTDSLIQQNIFKPELINRFDEVVLFRSLNKDELAQVVKLLIKEVNATLAKQNVVVELTDKAINKIVELGSDDRYGARPMRRALQRGVEDSVAQKILRGEAGPGSKILLDDKDIDL